MVWDLELWRKSGRKGILIKWCKTDQTCRGRWEKTGAHCRKARGYAINIYIFFCGIQLCIFCVVPFPILCLKLVYLKNISVTSRKSQEVSQKEQNAFVAFFDLQFWFCGSRTDWRGRWLKCCHYSEQKVELSSLFLHLDKGECCKKSEDPGQGKLYLNLEMPGSKFMEKAQSCSCQVLELRAF